MVLDKYFMSLLVKNSKKMRIYVGNGKFKTMKMFQKDEIVHTRSRLSLKTNRKPTCKGKSRNLWEMN